MQYKTLYFKQCSNSFLTVGFFLPINIFADDFLIIDNVN